MFVFMCLKLFCCRSFLPDVQLNKVQAHIHTGAWSHTRTFPSFSVWFLLFMSKFIGKQRAVWGVSDKIKRTEEGKRKRGRETKKWKKSGKPANGKSKVEGQKPEPVNHRQYSLW